MADSAAQEGFLYEKKAYAALGKYKISTGGIAGGSKNSFVPDIKVKTPTSAGVGCELKTTVTAAGSLVLKYINGKWAYPDLKGDVVKEFIHDIGEQFHLMKELNSSGPQGRLWRGKTPHLHNDPKNPKKKIVVGARNMQEAYTKDIAQYGRNNEVRINIPASVICSYYLKKNNSYINVGTDGFYTLNGRDKLNLNAKLKANKMAPIPDFSRSSRAIIRVRVQYKGGGQYQFVVAFAFDITRPSEYNIAPLLKGSKSDIDVKALAANPILLAFT